MNIHHLELFYYVAEHGGISEAVRHMPYGIQQPAISAQIIQLEESLGLTLFQRRPFALTKAGEELYEFIRPFFCELDNMANRLRGGSTHQLRVGASEVVQLYHLPEIVLNVRKKFPDLKLFLREGYKPQLEAWLLAQELDMIITVIEGRAPAGIHARELVRLPLSLLVEAKSPIRTAAELWKRDRIAEPLIALPAEEAICRNFQQALRKRGIDWFTSLEVSSLSLVEAYTANGFGIGLSLDVPLAPPGPGVRTLPLRDFPPVVVGAMWTGKLNPVMQCFLEECLHRAARLKS
jgi:DNA-binding transcriptional LysR family regulator